MLLHLLILSFLVFLGAPQGSIFCSLFLLYIRSSPIVSTVKQLEAEDILLFHCYAKALVGKLGRGLKANLNDHLSIFHSIQISIRHKKLSCYGKWQNHFTEKYTSTFTICRNFIGTKIWPYITIFSEKFSNQCKKQTNTKVYSNILPS